MSSEQPVTDAPVTVQVFSTSVIFVSPDGSTIAPVTSAASPTDVPTPPLSSVNEASPTTTPPNPEQSTVAQPSSVQTEVSNESNQSGTQSIGSENSNSQTPISTPSVVSSVSAQETSSAISQPVESTFQSLVSTTPVSSFETTQSTTAIETSSINPSVISSATFQQSSISPQSSSTLPAETTSVQSTIPPASSTLAETSNESADATVTFIVTSTSTVLPPTTSEPSESTTTSPLTLTPSTSELLTTPSTSTLRGSSTNTANPAEATTSGTGTANGSSSGGLSKGGVIAVAVAVPVGVILILALVAFLLWKRYKNTKATKSQRLAEVNDYSYNPNNSNSRVNLPTGGAGGAAAFGFAGASAVPDSGVSNTTSNNYRGWGPAPTSPQMEQVQGGNGFSNARLATVGSGTGSAALVRHGSSSEGEQSTHHRGSEDLMIPQDAIKNANNIHGIVNNYHSEEKNDVPAGSYYPPYNPNRPQIQLPQPKPYDGHGFVFDESANVSSPAVRYFNDSRPETPNQQRQLHIQNVAARRDSPKIEYSSWPDLPHEGTSGTHGVSQNF